MEKIISGKNINKSFVSQVEVLQNVDIDIYDGEFVVIMGPSGSGKSTLLLALGAMDTIDSGSIIFDGENIVTLNEKQLAKIRRNKMGFVFQQPTLLKNLNILDNIIYPHLSFGNREKIVKEARQLMDKVGIGELETRFITEVSGGQLQRASICRAVLNKPTVLFADEPTGALNSVSSKEIMEIFKELNREGITICMVTHDVNVATYATRVLFMKDGQVQAHLQFTGQNQDDKLIQIKEYMDRYDI